MYHSNIKLFLLHIFFLIKDFINICLNYTKTYGGLVKFQIGPIKQCVLITDYKMLEFILSSSNILKKSEAYDFLKPWLGSGLLIGSGK